MIRRFEKIIACKSLDHECRQRVNRLKDPVSELPRRSTRNFVTAIYFHCGSPDLMPSTHSILGGA